MVNAHRSADSPPVIPATPEEIIQRLLQRDRRVLLIGPPGTGKSTLVNVMAERLAGAGRDCHCLGVDPGSPLFGVPGAVCLGRWKNAVWELVRFEALCSLDAGRFRLPLVSAVRRLVPGLSSGVVLVDGPGVVRGVAGAELLSGLVEAVAIEAVLVVVREGRPLPLVQELCSLPVEVYRLNADARAHRPGKRLRAQARTRLWDVWLSAAEPCPLHCAGLRFLGMPPPLDVPAAWVGRQVALLDGNRTVTMGEVLALEGQRLRIRVPPGTAMPGTLLVRDSQRLEDGRLGTAPRFTGDRHDYLPPPDTAPWLPVTAAGGPRVVGRVGAVGVALLNGVFGDPLLHVRLRHQRRSLLFDLGEGGRLPARVAHQVSDVFITHAHIDHIAGFLWLLRSRIGAFPACRLYGPPGLAGNIAGLLRGILWDRVGEGGPRFEVTELHADRLVCYRLQAGNTGGALPEERQATEGVLLAEPGFRVRATMLDHLSPVLAYTFEPALEINIRRDRLRARNLPPGPWLGEMKRHLLGGDTAAPVALPGGHTETAGELAADLALVRPGKKLAYATDFADTAENRRRVVALAQGAHTLFCEATFIEADAEQAQRTAHLTTRACGEIATAAGAGRLVPFHFSRRYEKDAAQVYEEVAAACSRTLIPDLF